MKKILMSMALGMAGGCAGSYLLYTEYKKGNLPKPVNDMMKSANNVLKKNK